MSAVQPTRYKGNVAAAPKPAVPTAPKLDAAPNRKQAFAGANDKWTNAFAQQDAGTQERLKAIQNQGSVAQRQASELNARMGRGVGGGFGSMMAQANIGTQQQVNQAMGDAAKQKLDLSVQRAGAAEARGAQDMSMQQQRYLSGQGFAQESALNNQQNQFNAQQSQADRDQRITEMMQNQGFTREQATAAYQRERALNQQAQTFKLAQMDDEQSWKGQQAGADRTLQRQLQGNQLDFNYTQLGSQEAMQAAEWQNKSQSEADQRMFQAYQNELARGASRDEALINAMAQVAGANGDTSQFAGMLGG